MSSMATITEHEDENLAGRDFGKVDGDWEILYKARIRQRDTESKNSEDHARSPRA